MAETTGMTDAYEWRGRTVIGSDGEVTKEQAKDAPSVDDADGEISEEEEARLFRHYGVEYTDAGSVTATGAPKPVGSGRAAIGHDTSGPTTDEAMTPLRGGVAGRHDPA